MDVVCERALNIFERLLSGQTDTIGNFTPIVNVGYEVEGMGRSARFELLLAHFYDCPFINYCRENLLMMRRKIRQFLA
jgi:hypothetical protein